jgi:site-specific recombinase XerD
MDEIRMFEEYLRGSGRRFSPQSINAYLADLRMFSEWFDKVEGDSFRLKRVTPTAINQFISYLEKKGAQPVSINRRLSSLRRLFRWALDTGKLRDNPLRDTKNVRQVDPGPRWLDHADQLRLTRAAEKDVAAASNGGGKPGPALRLAYRNQAVLQLFLRAGLRVSEACALKTDQLDIERARPRVTIRSGKGNKKRIVPLSTKAAKALKTWLAVRPDIATTVFSDNDGNPLLPRGTQRMIEALGRRAGIDNLSPHDLRHTFSHNFMEAGGSLDVLAKLLGHSNINTTARYTKPGERDLERGIELLDERIA